MYKCLCCDNIFETPDTWEEKHGLDTPPYEEMSGCPECKGDYEQAKQCKGQCEKYFTQDDGFIGDDKGDKGWCHECAEKEFTFEKGLKFIGDRTVCIGLENGVKQYEELNLEHTFYLGWLWCIERRDPELLDLLKDEFMANGERHRELKYFCLDDIFEWIEFLESEG